MSIRDKLVTHINNNKIIFDNNSQELKDQLLGDNAGALITIRLQELINHLANIVDSHLRISSLVRSSSGTSHHGERRAVDIGNEEIANKILSDFSNDLNASLFKIDEIIFDAGGATSIARNRWNYNEGIRHSFSERVLNQHQDHIHFSVKSIISV